MALLLAIIGCKEKASPLVKEVTGGKVKGMLLQEHGVYSFKGIPFAQPPVGNLRWQAPQAVEPWEGIKECTAFSASPMQDKPRPFMFWSKEFLIPEEPISEDCLYLNVWTKAQSAEAKLPVLVYIYGGGFRSGGSACPIYDGTAMATKDVVFVSFNYRVGPFGFFSHPDIKPTPESPTGNYALMDMLAALRWVKSNIAKFGGDPNNVTIAGQSAGAFAVNHLVASPKSKGLFHKALAESGGHFYARAERPFTYLEDAQAQGKALADSLACQNLSELKKKSAEDILAMRWYQSTPIVDGEVVPRTVLETFKQGNQNDVPTIVGWNKDDIVFMPQVSHEVFPDYIKAQFGKYAEDFLAVYPHSTPKETSQALKDMNRDEVFASQGYAWAKWQKQTGSADVYVYNFNRALPASKPEAQFGAFHSGEIVYWYDNLHTLNRPWEDIDRTISTSLNQYLLNFLKTGNPNGAGLPTWQPYQPKEEDVLIIKEEITAKPLNKDKLSAWEKYYTQK